jgi:hypothetical protein
MKHSSSFLAVLLACTALIWHGCEADVDLNNIDTTVGVDATVALPLGSVSATIGDFVGDGTWGIFIDSLNNKGVLTFRDTFSMSRKFHTLDLSQYLSKASIPMKVYDKLDASHLLVDGKIAGTGITIPLEFPLTLNLNGINNDESYQRLDSALIKHASFVSNIKLSGGLPLEWEWIEKVTITLGEAFHRKSGNVVTVYTKGDEGGFNQDMLIDVDEFSMNLMKNPNLDPEKDADKYVQNNVNTSCDFKVTLYINIPTSAGLITIPTTSAFQYDLNVRFIDYHAVWGMFKPSKDMSDEAEISLTKEWDAWKLFKAAKLPFADPKVDMKITTQIAGALVVNGDYLYVKDSNGQQVNAMFDGKTYLRKHFIEGEYLSLNSEIGDSATIHILFDKDPARGHIDQLFTLQPDYLGYKFSIEFDRYESPQIRITDNTDIRIDAACELPFMFNEGVKLGYSDTITNIDLSMVTLDSLMESLPEVIDTIEEAKLTVALQIENTIPLQIKGSFICLDENNNVILDPETNEPFLIAGTDTLLIPTPDYTFNPSTATWDIKGGKMILTLKVDKDKLNTLVKVKNIVFDASLDDESLAYVYDKGYFNVKLTEYEGLTIKIGVGASVEAILGLDSLLQNQQ